MSCVSYEDQSVKIRMRVVVLFFVQLLLYYYYYYYYYYFYYYLLPLSFHTVEVVLTLGQTKNKNKYT